MQEQSPYFVAPFQALAPIYQQAGFAEYASRSLPNYINYAHSLNWAGRRVLDVGCGIGLTTWWLTENGYRSAGIESNPHMLTAAQETIDQRIAAAEAEGIMHTPPEMVAGDLRGLVSPIGAVDLVAAVNGVVNNIHQLRELELAFRGAWNVLEPDKLFVFDVHTIRGLAANLGSRDEIVYNDGQSLTVIVRNSFNFETLANTQHFIILRNGTGGWRRQEEFHVQKGYPVQGISALLERTGFIPEAVLNPDMTPFNPNEDPYGRAVFVARKSGE